MSLRDLVEPDCQGANSLMRFGNHIRHDTAYKDAGFGPSTSTFVNRPHEFRSDQLVEEFLGQIAPPQSFQMDALLQEMRDIDGRPFHNHIVQRPPLVIEEVNRGFDWANEFSTGANPQFHPNVDEFAAIENKQLDGFWNQNVQNAQGVVGPLASKPWENEFLDVSESLQQMVSVHFAL